MATYSISPPMTRALKWAELGELTGPSNNSSIRALLKRDYIEAETVVGTYRGYLFLQWKITDLGRKGLEVSEWLDTPWFRREFGPRPVFAHVVPATTTLDRISDHKR